MTHGRAVTKTVGAVITPLCDLLNLYKRTLPEITIYISSTNYVDRDRVPFVYVRVVRYNLAISCIGP